MMQFLTALPTLLDQARLYSRRDGGAIVAVAHLYMRLDQQAAP